MASEATDRAPWSMKIVWALLSLAAPLLAASAFFAFEAARGVAHGFAFEMVLATIFGLLLPLGVLAIARRRGAWAGPGTRLFCLAAFAVAGLFAVLAACVGWLS
jgi:hypothetical protein